MIEERFPNVSVMRADICVVGAGAAGIAIARRLDGTALRVLVLESGGMSPEPFASALNSGTVSGSSSGAMLSTSRVRTFGGSTFHWGGWVCPMGPREFEARPGLPPWPISAEQLNPYYVDAAEVVGVRPFEGTLTPYGGSCTDAETIQDCGTPALGGACQASCGTCPETGDCPDKPLLTGTGLSAHRKQLVATGDFEAFDWQWATRKKFAEEYRGQLEASANIRVLLHATCVDITLGKGGDHVMSVRVRDPALREIQVEARQFVIATGGIENARVLLAANSVHKEGIGNHAGHLGRYFMDHYELSVGHAVLWRPEGWSDMLPRAETFGGRRLQCVGGVATTSRLEAQTGGLRNTLSFRSCTQDPESAIDVARSAMWLDERLSGTGGPSRWLSMDLHCSLEQRPKASNRVELMAERDALGTPRVTVHHTLDADEQETLRATSMAMVRRLREASLGRVKMMLGRGSEIRGRALSDKWGSYVTVMSHAGDQGADAVTNAYLAGHHTGTTRMSRDAQDGVVDPDCRVHGLDNLYVVGSSVFPTNSAPNPTFTILALALRLADHLRGQLR